MLPWLLTHARGPTALLHGETFVYNYSAAINQHLAIFSFPFVLFVYGGGK